MDCMTHQLRGGLSYCVCAGRIVFLDIDADRYFCLGPDLEASFRLWAAGTAEGDDGPGLLSLCERGIIVPGKGGNVPPCHISLQVAGDLDAEMRPRLRDLLLALAAELSAAFRLRIRPLAKMLASGKSGSLQHPSGAGQSSLHAARIAAAFARSALILGSTDRCLSRALAALSVCRRRGVAATLVFGVQLNPFAAHAWVQVDDKILVGDFEQCRLFTPILALS
jgi:hypothetical protein